MHRTAALLFGVFILVIGVLGFLPATSHNGYLFGLFHVNFLHNLMHIATGFIALLCGLQSYSATRWFFKVFGVFYALIGLLGFYYWNTPIFGILANNLADNFLHLGIAALSLFLGFGKVKRWD